MQTNPRLFLAALAFSSFSFAAMESRAGLIGRDLDGDSSTFEAIYDSDLDITWLADANAAAGSGYDDGYDNTDGRLTWISAMAWAAELDVWGYSDWRLPETRLPDTSCHSAYAGGYGDNCVGSPMGHLFYEELSGSANESIFSAGDSDLSLFQNLHSSTYWSSTTIFESQAWHFSFNDGDQGFGSKTSDLLAWAVRDGDTLAIPSPNSLGVLLLGLSLFLIRQSLGCLSISVRKKISQEKAQEQNR